MRNWIGISAAQLRRLLGREPGHYQRADAETLDIALLKDEQNKQLVADLSGCLTGLVVKIETDSHQYEVHHEPRTTNDLYAIHPVDDVEHAAMLKIVEAAIEGMAFGNQIVVQSGNNDVTRTHIGFPKKLNISQIIKSIDTYLALTHDGQASPDKPIKNVSIGPVHFCIMNVYLYDRENLAGLNLSEYC